MQPVRTFLLTDPECGVTAATCPSVGQAIALSDGCLDVLRNGLRKRRFTVRQGQKASGLAEKKHPPILTFVQLK